MEGIQKVKGNLFDVLDQRICSAIEYAALLAIHRNAHRLGCPHHKEGVDG